jgi:hypothetical protein
MDERAPITLDPARHPWEQQPRESDKVFGRFLLYRNLGRRRTLTSLAKVLTECGDKLTYGTLKYHSHRYAWTTRVQAYDSHRDDADADRLADLRTKLVEEHLTISKGLLAKALTALKDIPVGSIEPADIVRMIKLATDLKVRALGEPTHTIAVTGKAGGPIQTEDLTNLDPDQRRTRLREIAEELARRAASTDDD